MSIEKAIELLESRGLESIHTEGGKDCFWRCGCGICTTRKLVFLVLAELQKQPPAGEFTNTFRHYLGALGTMDIENSQVRAKGIEACTRLDQQAEDNKNQAAEIKWLKKYTRHLRTCRIMTTQTGDTRCTCGFKQGPKRHGRNNR